MISFVGFCWFFLQFSDNNTSVIVNMSLVLRIFFLSVLMQVEDPLLEATKYLKLLQKSSPKSLETHLLSFELNTRKQKILLAFQVFCLKLRYAELCWISIGVLCTRAVQKFLDVMFNIKF